MKGTHLAAALLAIGLPAGADEPAPTRIPEGDDPPRVHEKITVTGHPILQGTRYDGLAGSVSSVGEEQIRDLAAQDVASALRRVPGVILSRYNPVGSYGGGDGGALFVRGQGAGRPGAEISTLVDGVPRFVGVWTHPLLDLLSIDLAQQVDVYRGAQPVLLGNMAFASIDLVPKRRAEAGFGGRLSAAYGSFDTSALTFEQDGRSGRLDYRVSASHRQSDGHRSGADGRTRALSGRVGVAVADGWDLSLLVDATDGRAHDPGAEGAPARPVTPLFDSGDGLGVLTLTRRQGQHEGHIKLFVDDGSIDWLQWDAARRQPFSTLTDWTNYGLRARDRVRFASGGTLTAGIDADRYGGQAEEERPAGTQPLGDFRFGNDAAYVAYEQSFGGATKVTPSAGVRFNHSRYFGDQWGGQAALAVESGWGRAHVRYAHAYNLPGVWVASFYQGYGRGEQWKELAPELLDHLEVGFARSFGSRARLELTVFRSATSDALRFVPPPPPPPAFANLGSYRARGAELTLQAEPARGLSLFVGGTWSATTPEDIPFTPHATATAGLTFTRSHWHLSLDAQALDRRSFGNLRFPGPLVPVDGFFLLNGRLAYQVRAGQRPTELWVAAENLTGADYAYRPGYPMPGRSVLAGLGWGF